MATRCCTHSSSREANALYANTYIRTPRFLNNEAAGREEALTTFGDLTLHGLSVAKKFAFNALKQRAGPYRAWQTTWRRIRPPPRSSSVVPCTHA